MAYLPGYEHDLFLSYAHSDVQWVSALEEQLTERLTSRLGSKCEIWQDEKKLRTGQNFPAELDKAVRSSAAFIAILSRHYQSSSWCETELDAFLDPTGQHVPETGGYGRFMKVIRLPWFDNAHEGFHRNIQHVSFYETDPKTGQDREFRYTSDSFYNAVDKLGFHIEKLFEAMLRNMEIVFVARAAADVSEERDAIAREIRAAGYGLWPPPQGYLQKGLDRQALRKFVNEAGVTVHILGSAYDEMAQYQIDDALEAGKRVIFCLARGHESATGKQRDLIDAIRENRWKIREGTWSLLENRSPAVMRQDLIASLQPSRPAAPRNDDKAHVYLMCDPTTAEDSAFARELQGRIGEHEPKIQVDVQQPAGDNVSAGARHEQLIRESDGLLLYHDKAPRGWYNRNFGDLLMADETKERAMLLSGYNVVYPGLTVVQRQDPFDLNQLEPFLAQMRSKPEATGAHAGQ